MRTAFEPGQVSAHESIAQHIANGCEDVGRIGTGGISAERDQRAELVARLIFENGCGSANQRLPEKLKDAVLLDILLETEHL